MKKNVFCFVTLFFALILFTGCNNKNDSIKSIDDAKTEVESIVSEIIEFNNNLFTNPSKETISQEFFNSIFLTSSRDLRINLEQKYNSGDKIYLKYNDGEINGKTIGADPNDENKYYIYIGNENYDDLWSYGTVDLTSGNISWENGY